MRILRLKPTPKEPVAVERKEQPPDDEAAAQESKAPDDEVAAQESKAPDDEAAAQESKAPDVAEAAQESKAPDVAAVARGSPAPGVPGGRHVVKRGDTLWAIAEKWYGDARLWPVIFQASEARIADPDLIHPGAQISVPALEGSAFALTVTDRQGIAKGYVAAYRAYLRLGSRPARPFLLEARRRDPAVVQRKGIGKGGRGIVGLVPSPGRSAATARASPAPGATAPGVPGVPGGTHRVEGGDTLWAIAANRYGDARLWPVIFRANQGRLPNPDLIHPGAQITVPSLQGTASEPTPADRSGIAEGYVAAYRAYRRLGTRPALPFLLEARRRDPAAVRRMEVQRP